MKRLIDLDEALRGLDGMFPAEVKSEYQQGIASGLALAKVRIVSMPSVEKITEQELIDEAKRQGYVIFKRKEWVSLLKCPVCGRKPLKWGDAFSVYYECQNGCLTGGKGNQRQARVLWNKAVEEEGAWKCLG